MDRQDALILVAQIQKEAAELMVALVEYDDEDLDLSGVVNVNEHIERLLTAVDQIRGF